MPTLYQGYVLMAIIFYGFLYGILYQPKIFIQELIKDNKIVIFILEFLYAIIGGVIFWLGIFESNLGVFRIFLLIVYILSFMLVNFCLKNILRRFCYMFSIINIWIKFILILFCTTLIYFSGDLMINISEKHNKYEWINTVIAFIDIILIAFVIILSLQVVLIVLPLVITIITIIVIIDILIYGFMFVIQKIRNKFYN